MTTHVTEPPREAVEAEVASAETALPLAPLAALAALAPLAAPLSGEPLSSAPTSGAGGASERSAWLGLGATGILAVLVFWVFEALPFQDLPAHAGLIAMRHRYLESAFESRFFVL